AVAGGEAALESRELPVNAREAHAVTAVVRTRRPRADLATREFLGHDLRDLAHAVVFRIVADVEHLAAHRVLRREQAPVDRLADILHVHEGPPGTAVAHHGNAAGGPCQRAKI